MSEDKKSLTLNLDEPIHQISDQRAYDFFGQRNSPKKRGNLTERKQSHDVFSHEQNQISLGLIKTFTNEEREENLKRAIEFRQE